MPKIALGHPFLKRDPIKPMLSGLDFKKRVKQVEGIISKKSLSLKTMHIADVLASGWE